MCIVKPLLNPLEEPSLSHKKNCEIDRDMQLMQKRKEKTPPSNEGKNHDASMMLENHMRCVFK